MDAAVSASRTAVLVSFALIPALRAAVLASFALVPALCMFALTLCADV